MLSTAATPYAARASGAPDLKVTKVAFAEGHVAAGGSITVHETTKNVGAAKAGPSRTGYWLSKDTAKSAKDRALGDRAVGRLRPDHADATTSHLTVPATTPAGRWHLIACADVGKAVREQSERNNCHATSTRLEVTAPTSVGVSFPQTPHPMKVTPTFETPAAPVSVPPDADKTAAVTGPDGTTYALTIPAHAVDQQTSITLTPLTALGDAPTSSLVGGVRIQPTGLLLNDDAVLTITPPSTPSRTTATGFRFYDGGAELGMVPLDPVGGTPASVSLDVSVLATYAVANSSDADRATALAHPPTLVNGQFDNVIAPLVRTQQLTRADTSPLAADTENYYQQVIKPHLDKALAGDPNGPTYVHDALAFLHEQAVLGAPDPHEADITTEVLSILAKEVREAYTRCKNQHSMPDLGRLLAAARSYAVLGAEADAGNAFDKYLACGHFDVTFTVHTTRHQHYVTTFGDTYDIDASWSYSTAEPVHLDANAVGSFDGTGPIVHGAYSFAEKAVNFCDDHRTMTTRTTLTGTTDGVEGALLVVDLQPQSFYVAPGIPPIEIAHEPQLRIGSNIPPKETYTSATTGCSSSSNSTTTPRWYFTHTTADFPNPWLPDSPQTGAVLFDLIQDFDNQGAGDISAPHITDTTSIRVTHVPQ